MFYTPYEITKFQEAFQEKLKTQRDIFVDQLIRREGSDVTRDELRGKIIMIDDVLSITDLLIQELYSERKA